MKHICIVAGARPNFMKIAPLIRAIQSRPERCRYTLVHTGQHYDQSMSDVFFTDLGIPKPDHYLNVGSGTHATQTAAVLSAFEPICMAENPDIVIVVGDVNSTLAATLVAKKLNIKVAHVEAGLRSGDRSMPEEINRLMTDAVSDWFFVTEPDALENLKKEGVPEGNIHYVGHVMIDNLLYQVEKLRSTQLEDIPIKKPTNRYIFLTMHRPSNVDNPTVLSALLNACNEIAETWPIVFLCHPRTKKQIESLKDFTLHKNIILHPPLGYSQSLFLWMNASAVLTDSGGLQEETTALKIPCITMRNNTERPITLTTGSNELAGQNPKKITALIEQAMSGKWKPCYIPELWDGKASERIIDVLLRQ